VNLADVAHVLSGMPEVDEWQVEIRKRNDDPFEIDEVRVFVAPRNGYTGEVLTGRIRERLLAATEISPNEVVYLPLDQILQRLGMETEMKEKRFLDRRPRS
jgi:hypothetical protein